VIECNADLGRPCDAGGAETDERAAIQCPRCQAAYAEAARSYRAWGPVHPAGYSDDMRAAGRRHLLRGDEP
jgi:hypothetical protein